MRSGDAQLSPATVFIHMLEGLPLPQRTSEPVKVTVLASVHLVFSRLLIFADNIAMRIQLNS